MDSKGSPLLWSISTSTQFLYLEREFRSPCPCIRGLLHGDICSAGHSISRPVCRHLSPNRERSQSSRFHPENRPRPTQCDGSSLLTFKWENLECVFSHYFLLNFQRKRVSE